MRDVIARALHEHRSARAAANIEAARAAFGPNVGTGALPYEMVEADHLAEADVVIDAIVAAIGWPEIKAYQEELAKGQDVREDGGGYFARAIGALIGKKAEPVETYQQAAKRLLREV